MFLTDSILSATGLYLVDLRYISDLELCAAGEESCAIVIELVYGMELIGMLLLAGG